VAVAKVLATASHPSYAAPPGHDFMLAYLDTDLPAEPIPVASAPPNGANVQAVGYGWTSASSSDENTSRWWVCEPVVRVSNASFTVDGQGRHGLCLGDSGGPALVPGPYLVGTLSAGSETCVGSDVFAIPAVDADWIEQQIGLWHSNPPASLGKFPWSLVLGGAAVIGIGAVLRKS